MSETKHTPRWIPKFWKTIPNETAPDGKVDAYLVVDDETGVGMISLAVPFGDKETPIKVCDAVNRHDKLKADVATLLKALNVFSSLNHDCRARIHGPVACDFCNAWERARAAIAAAEKE